MTTRKATIVALASVVGLRLGPAVASAQTEQAVPHTIVVDADAPPDPDEVRSRSNPVDLASTQAELDQLWIDFAFSYDGTVSSSDPPDAWRDVPPIDLDTHVAIGCVCPAVLEGVFSDGERLVVSIGPAASSGSTMDIRVRRVLLAVPRTALPGSSFDLVYREEGQEWPPVSVTVTGEAGPELAATGPRLLAPAAIALLLTGTAMVVLVRPRRGRS